MDFREYAAKETSELAARLTKAAAVIAEQTAKHAAEQASKQAAEQAAQHARDEAQKVADGLRAQLKTATDEKAAVAASLKEAQTQAERLRGELKSTTDRVETTARQLEDARKTADKLEAARAELTAARDEQAAARKAAEGEVRKAREAADGLRTELAGATKALEKATAERLESDEASAAAHSQSQAAEVKLTAVTDLLKKNAGRVKTLEQTQQAYEHKIQELEAKLQQGTRQGSASASTLDDLLAGFQALGAATTIADVLTTLVEQMAGQFPRVALFRLKKGHLQGEHQIGFDLKNDIGKLVLPLGMDSLPARAASSGQIESLAGEELKKSRTPFSGGTPAHALAMPLVVAGETLAVVYADDSGAAARERSGGADVLNAQRAEAMRQFAVAVLLRLSNELKALAELQKYAASLLNEMEQMYNADVESGLGSADLQKRLAGNLDYARSIYGSRTALESADAATLIDDEIAALIDARKGTPFARDLAAAAGLPAARSAAEAS
jgi:hypothetical protein